MTRDFPTWDKEQNNIDKLPPKDNDVCYDVKTMTLRILPFYY